MEHVFSLLVIGAAMLGLLTIFGIGELLMFLFEKMFPNLSEIIYNLICR